MDDGATRTPIHLWIVGALATAWDAFGCYDYFMTRTRGAEHIKAMMPGVDANAYMAYINAFPTWASIGWALGVWFGLAGGILLLLRHRLAPMALLISLAGAIVGLGYQILRPASIAGMSDAANMFVPVAIIIVALGLFVYARAMRLRGVLR